MRSPSNSRNVSVPRTFFRDHYSYMTSFGEDIIFCTYWNAGFKNRRYTTKYTYAKETTTDDGNYVITDDQITTLLRNKNDMVMTKIQSSRTGRVISPGTFSNASDAALSWMSSSSLSSSLSSSFCLCCRSRRHSLPCWRI